MLRIDTQACTQDETVVFNNFLDVQEDSPNDPDEFVRLARSTLFAWEAWEAMGKPEVITISIEPGDLLNEVGGQEVEGHITQDKS